MMCGNSGRLSTKTVLSCLVLLATALSSAYHIGCNLVTRTNMDKTKGDIMKHSYVFRKYEADQSFFWKLYHVLTVTSPDHNQNVLTQSGCMCYNPLSENSLNRDLHVKCQKFIHINIDFPMKTSLLIHSSHIYHTAALMIKVYHLIFSSQVN